MSQGIKNFRWTSLMWAINDFPLYEMVLGWSTYRKLACLYYMENNKAFTLINGDKAFFFLLLDVLANLSLIEKQWKELFEMFERNIAPSILLGEELYKVVSQLNFW
jgi:hypothetical protein